MLINIFRDLHGALKADYLSATELNSWAESFFNYEYQPAFWLIELLSCSNKSAMLKIIENANYDYLRNTSDYLEAYVGFCYLAFKEGKISFRDLKRNLIIELDGGEEADILIPVDNNVNDASWLDLKRLGLVCEQNYKYLFIEQFYLFERNTLFQN